MVERVRIFKDKYENNRKDYNFFTAMSMVHRHLQTTPGVGITQLQKLGHANILGRKCDLNGSLVFAKMCTTQKFKFTHE